MTFSRRALLFASAACGAAWFARSAHAEAIDYRYDQFGRVVSVTYSNGTTVTYTYDAAGNRTQVACCTNPPAPFTQTIAITGTGGVNLRTLANSAGYNGAQDAIITYTLASNVTLTGSAGGPNGGTGIDTGVWPHTLYSTQLILQISGKVRGGGGRGGKGAGAGPENGEAGGSGGAAINCQLPLTVTVNSGGELRGGGGGAGGGGSLINNVSEFVCVGGGGGGGYPNGAAGLHGTWPLGDTGDATNGAPGTLSGGGAGGNRQTNGTSSGGDGGDGGNSGVAGQAGGSATGTGTKRSGGASGPAGYAIRQNGFPLALTNNGSISGTVG